MHRSLRQSFAALLTTSICNTLSVAHAADTLFAAPAANTTSHVSSVGSTGHVTLALAIVLVCVFAAAWVLKKLRKLQVGPHGVDIKIVAQVALGTKERAVLLQVRNVQLLVGVSGGQVNTLHAFTGDSLLEPEKNTTVLPAQSADVGHSTSQLDKPSFQAILKKSLGL
jgi:flagellar protein FliO/FliZ